MAREDRAKEKRQLLISVLLALAALVSITAATVAWFTIADFTKVHSMSMEITSGTNLRFDLDAHEQFEEYCKVLSFSQIADRIQRDLGYDMRKVPLEPVTTRDFQIFTFEDGTVAEPSDGAYLEFTLHFMAAEDMLIHLTSQDSGNGRDGTVVQSTNAGHENQLFRGWTGAGVSSRHGRYQYDGRKCEIFWLAGWGKNAAQ